MSYSTQVSGVQRRRAAGIVAVFTLLLTVLLPMSAQADWNASVGRGVEIRGVNVSGSLRLGPHYVQTPSISGQPVEDMPIWCVNGKFADPGPGEMTSIATLTDSYKWGPAELQLETAQMAWLLNKYQTNKDDNNLAALSYLVHVNFEQPKGNYDARGVVNEIVAAVRAQIPHVDSLARQYVQEARANAVIGYEAGTVTGDGQRTGTINNIGVHPDNRAAWVAGIPITVTLSGPAVFDATGTNTWSGTTAAEPISLAWTATGNGEVNYSWTVQSTHRRTLTKLGADGSVQDMLSYGNRPASDPERITVDGPSWRVVFAFQPQGVSQVVSQEVSDGTVRDTFTTSVDPNVGSGEWVALADGRPVPVQYRATAYYVGADKPAETATVPEGAEELGSVLVEATGAGQELSAEFELSKRGWVTWVWEVRKADQGSYAEYVLADWADSFGLDAETSRENFPFRPMGVSNVDSAKVIDTGQALTDTFTANADPHFFDGQWTRLGEGSFNEGQFVPVTYRANVYFVSATELPVEADVAPENAELVKSVTVTATEPGQVLSADAGQALKDGFYTWVWEVREEDQPEQFRTWIESGWADSYGLADETTSKRYEAQVDSALSVRDTKSGTYLVDDVWVSGLPVNHPDFAGGHGFKADVAEISHEVLFFPDGLEVIEANRDRAEKIGDTVTIPAKSGFYPSIGDTTWIAKTDEDGTLVAGTYVFVSTFAGDDRVAPLTTSVEDKSEQFTVSPEPSIHTTLMYESTRGPVPAGPVTLVDQVAYTNLVPGIEYTVKGQIMVTSTGKALTDGEGRPVQAQATFTPESANGTVDVTFTVDLAGYAGEQIVAFETLYEDGVELAVHADINDENQTLPVTKLSTSATDKADGDKVIERQGVQTIVDQVCEHSGQLIAGSEYTIATTLMQDNGKPVVDKDGQPVTVTKSFVPKTADECASVEISFDAGLVQGSKVVVFETVETSGTVIAVHHDLSDTAQTVTFKDASRGAASRGLALTGGSVVGLLGAGAGLAAAGGLLVWRRHRSSSAGLVDA